MAWAGVADRRSHRQAAQGQLVLVCPSSFSLWDAFRASVEFRLTFGRMRPLGEGLEGNVALLRGWLGRVLAGIEAALFPPQGICRECGCRVEDDQNMCKQCWGEAQW